MADRFSKAFSNLNIKSSGQAPSPFSGLVDPALLGGDDESTPKKETDNADLQFDPMSSLNASAPVTAAPGQKPAAPGAKPAAPTTNKCIQNGAYVNIDKDNMKAWIYLNPPAEGEDYYSRDLIMKFIKEYGIVKGFHESNISAIAKKHVYGREILVAKGEEPVECVNGSFEFFFDTIDRRKPAEREDGTIDYSSVYRLSNVKEGDKVAEYHPGLPGKDGFDIFGKVIKCKPFKDLPPLKGQGISNSRNPHVYVATVSGKIDFVNGRIDIKNVHEIHGDIDAVNGQIDFFGDVHVSGNVGAGAVIRASRNVTVDGVVEAAQIFAGGSVTIAKGVQGNLKASIHAKGTVCAEFLEYCKVEAGENVRSNSYISTEVSAQGMILAEGKNGSIIGGKVKGLLGVTANNVGNDNNVKTNVFSGYSADDYDKYVNSTQAENEVQKALSDSVEEMSNFIKQKRLGRDVLSTDIDEKVNALNAKKDELFEKLDKIRTEKEELSTIIEKGKGSVIVVNNKIYVGTTICIEGAYHMVYENTSFMRYKNSGGRIEASVINV